MTTAVGAGFTPARMTMNHPTSPFDKGGSRGILDTDAASALPPPANFLAAANNLPSPGGRG
jgi:hypothetical protein